MGLQFRPGVVGTDAEHDHVVFLQVALHQVLRAHELGLHTQFVERFRHRIAGAHHVADAQAGGHLHVHAGGAVGGRRIEIIGTQVGVADCGESFLVLPSAGFGDGGDRIRLLLQAIGEDLEANGLLKTRALDGEWRGRRLRTPAGGQREPHIPVGAGILFRLHHGGERE